MGAAATGLRVRGGNPGGVGARKGGAFGEAWGPTIGAGLGALGGLAVPD